MKTLKQLSDELGISKQTLYRYVKNAGIREAHHDAHHDTEQGNTVKYYDEAAEQAIKQHFAALDAKREAHHKALHDAEHAEILKQYEALVKQCDAVTAERDNLREQLDQANTDRAFLREQLEHMRTDHADQLRQMQSIIDRLTDQLDQERQHSREQSDRLAQLADQAQRLQLAAMNSRPLDQITDQQTQEKPLTFWQRLFKRK